MSEIAIDLQGYHLRGELQIPKKSGQLVIFAHGSGSSRLSPRNRYVAQAFNMKGIATCLFDLLTQEEEAIDLITRELRFDITLLSNRLVEVARWLQRSYHPSHFNYGYFGSSTGAAAALLASTQNETIKAVVSRGGRPDLVGEALGSVKAATLLIVGAQDPVVTELNQQAFRQLSAEKELAIVPNATHLFEEPGTLDEVIQLAMGWFMTHLL